MTVPPADAATLITDGLDQIIDGFFDVTRKGRSLRHTSLFRDLCKKPPELDGAEFIGRLLERIESNRSDLTNRGVPSRSVKTWRGEPRTDLIRNNTSPETRIERAIAKLLDDDWFNQVPVASGLSEREETKSNLDIVHRRSPFEFDFIELKALRTGADLRADQTPLSAAMELLKYALLFRHSKKHRAVLFPDPSVERPVLEAATVHLEVLATANCYRDATSSAPFAIAWLDQLVDDLMVELSRQSHGLASFDFVFTQFPDTFCWTDSDHEQLLDGKEGDAQWMALRSKIETAVISRQPVRTRG